MNLVELHIVKTGGQISLHFERFETAIQALSAIFRNNGLKPDLALQLVIMLHTVENKSRQCAIGRCNFKTKLKRLIRFPGRGAESKIKRHTIILCRSAHAPRSLES